MFPRKKKIEQTVVLDDIDPVVCQTVLKGTVDGSGRCVVKATYEPGSPEKVTLEEIRMVEMRKAPKPAPAKEEEE